MGKAALNEIRVSVPNDGSVAELWFPKGTTPDDADLETCLIFLRQADIVINESVKAAVEQAVENINPEDVSRFVVATAQKPKHGTPGRIEWLIDISALEIQATNANHDSQDDNTQADNESSQADFYGQSSFVMLETGDRIAVIHPPTEGEDGIDVRGKNIAAKIGKPAKFVTDDSLSITNSGYVVVEREGVLSRSGAVYAVRDSLVIDNNVDFSTGNVEFDGNLSIRQGIKDLFKVQCSGEIDVGALIEAAHIVCGGNFTARGGMAAREQGTLDCGGNAHARYFDSAKLTVKGHLSFERELNNCTTMVNGNITSPGGSIIGGTTQCAGSITIGMLGSKGGARTYVKVGSVPSLELRKSQLQQLQSKLTSQHEQETRELARLAEPGRQLSPDQIERQTELMFNEQTYQSKLKKIHQGIAAIENKLRSIASVDITVERMLYHGTIIKTGDVQCRITRDTRGPLRISQSSTGSLVYLSGHNAEPAPLAEIGETKLLEQNAA